MRQALRSRMLIAVVATTLGATLAGGIAWAVTVVPPNSTDRYYACVGILGRVRQDTVRFNTPPTSCPKAADTVRSWNAQGPQGLPGSDAQAASVAHLALPGHPSPCSFPIPPGEGPWAYSTPGATGCHQPADAAIFVARATLPLDSADYPTGTTARFTGVLGAQGNESTGGTTQVCVRVYDFDTASAVPGSTACLTDEANGDNIGSEEIIDVGLPSLPAGQHHYAVDYIVETDPPSGSGSGHISNASLVLDW